MGAKVRSAISGTINIAVFTGWDQADFYADFGGFGSNQTWGFRIILCFSEGGLFMTGPPISSETREEDKPGMKQLKMAGNLAINSLWMVGALGKNVCEA
ncbi:hypothetical protein L1049_011526 [Liquidambar formosana]|uniref:Uncharacterized protein n=1 Tax=Liquidambar formosana TaxID=63359 RepID=A0AAP0RRR9_LIQFO